MPPENKSPLESLEERIYRAQQGTVASASAYSDQEQVQPYGWTPPPAPLPSKRRMPWTVWFLIATGIFLVLAGSVAAFLLFAGTRSISSDRVEIEVQGPPSIASGEPASFIITVHNTNPAAMKDANLYATLPPGTRAGDGSDQLRPQYVEPLGTIEAGGEMTRTLSVKIYGNQNQSVTIPVRVEYHTDGSNALFVKEKDFTFTVATSPISVQVQTLSQTPSGQPFTVTVLVRSNASSPVSGVALLAQYPSGYSLTSSVPQPSNNLFSIGDLAPGEEKTVKITGTLTGTNAEERVFRFSVGSVNPDGTSTLGNSYAEALASVRLTNPFLNVGLSLNREAADSIVASPGEAVSALLSWQNTLTETLTDASIQVALSGNALDASTVSGGTGFYRSSDSSVIFSKDTNSALASLGAGDSGAGSFSFKTKQAAALAGVRNPMVTLNVSVAGRQASQGAQAPMLSSTVTRTVKIGTTVTLTSELARTGSFTNTGPVPAVAGTETTYTVNLTAKNTVNSVGGAKVSMTLPAYVRYTGQAAPSSAVAYNAETRVVTWTVGDLAPGASATVALQVGLLPSTSQNGTSPIVVGDQSFTGVDRFTGAQVTATALPLTAEVH